MALPSLTRNARRFEEIARVLIKYGLAEWMGDTLPAPAKARLSGTEGQSLTELRREERIRLALTELGTTFLKLGQVFSTQADLVGQELAESRSAELRLLAPRAMARQLRRRMLSELDFEREALNRRRFRRQSAGDQRVVFPEPSPEPSTRRLLTMERIEGRSARESDALKAAGHDLQALAARGPLEDHLPRAAPGGKTAIAEQRVIGARVHCDPHAWAVMI